MSMIIPLPPYDAPYKPLNNITPFTYRDGLTYLQKLEGLSDYINSTIVPFVNDNFNELGTEFETQVNTLITNVNAAIQAVVGSSIVAQDPVVAQLVAEVTSATHAAVVSLINSSVDSATAALIPNQNSALRIALDPYVDGRADSRINTQVDAKTASNIGNPTSATKGALDAYSDPEFAAIVNNPTSQGRVALNPYVDGRVDGRNSATLDGNVASLIGTASSTTHTALKTFTDAEISATVDTDVSNLVNDATSKTRIALDPYVDSRADARIHSKVDSEVAPIVPASSGSATNIALQALIDLNNKFIKSLNTGINTGGGQVNTTPDSIIQRGLAFMQGNGTSSGSVNITFPIAFKAGTFPSVQLTSLGGKAHPSIDPGGTTGGIFPQVTALTNTGCTLTGFVSSGTLPNTTDYWFAWEAVGEKA